MIAEEVAGVYPDLVTFSAAGEIEGVQHHKLNAMLLNEIQRQHRRLRQQEELILDLEQRLSRLERRVAEQGR